MHRYNKINNQLGWPFMLNKFNWNQEELNSYEAAIKKDMDYNAAMEQKFDEGLEKGKVEGKIENAKEIALAMLAKCLDINLISDVTKLSVKEVQDLKFSS